jgi:hypothetical protein
MRYYSDAEKLSYYKGLWRGFLTASIVHASLAVIFVVVQRIIMEK